jgi:putative copper resistance protein D
MDAAVALLRVVQFAAATVLCGTPLFLLYGLGEADRARLAWPRRLTSGASLVLLLGAAAALLAQTAAMAGDPAAAFDGEMLATVVTETTSGVAIVARGLAAAAALALCLIRPTGKGLWLGSTVLGAVALASFAWTGHGAATEGAGALPHLVADILHLLAAGVWIGALTALALALLRRSVFLETAAGFAILALVGVLGVLVPVASQ